MKSKNEGKLGLHALRGDERGRRKKIRQTGED